MSKKFLISLPLYCFLRLVYHFMPKHSAPRRLLTVRLRKLRTNPECIDTELEADVQRCKLILDYFDSKTEVLFIGSSHTAFGFAPKEWQTLHTWNAGIDAGTLKVAYAMYNALRKKWQGAGQLVVLSDDMFGCSNQMELTTLFLMPLVLTKYTDYRFDSNLLLRPFLKRLEKVMARLSNIELPEAILAERGFCKNDANEEITKESCIERAQGHLKFTTFEPTELIWLERLKEAVEADGRRLVFLRFPCHPDYTAAIEAACKNGMDAWQRYKPYYKDCIHLDYFSYPLDESSYADADHLTTEGARHFSRLIEPVFQRLLKEQN